MMRERRRKIVPISSTLLYDMLTVSDTAMTIRCTQGLPADACFVGHGIDLQRNMHYLVFESAEWDIVPEFETLPIFTPRFTSYTIAPLLEKAAALIQGRADTPYAADWLREYEQFREMLT